MRISSRCSRPANDRRYLAARSGVCLQKKRKVVLHSSSIIFIFCLAQLAIENMVSKSIGISVMLCLDQEQPIEEQWKQARRQPVASNHSHDVGREQFDDVWNSRYGKIGNNIRQPDDQTADRTTPRDFPAIGDLPSVMPASFNRCEPDSNSTANT